MKLTWYFPGGGGLQISITFCGESMDIFWNYKIKLSDFGGSYFKLRPNKNKSSLKVLLFILMKIRSQTRVKVSTNITLDCSPLVLILMT